MIDAAGNMTYDGFNSYTYDAEGNITAVTGGAAATYVYNALNQRVRTVVGTATTEFVFNAGGQRVSEWGVTTTAGVTTRAQLKGKYYWGGKPVAYYTTASSGGAGLHFEHTDWLGTERLRTTYNGGLDGTYTSLPFGDAQTTTSGVDSDAAHYAQLDHDAETNTDHADFRQYSNAQGRWLSPDPYDGSYDGSNPQSMNRYFYAADSPLSYVDPSGLDTIQVPCGVHIWYVIEDYQMKILWWDIIYCSINNGNSTGNSSSNDPNNGSTWSQQNKACLDKINSTPDGKFYNFFSYASPLFSLDDAASEGAKRGAKSFLKAGAKNWGRTALGKGSGFVASAWETVDYALAPISAAATAGQLTVHAGCAIAATF